MSDNNNCNELSEILLYDGNDEEFKQYNESLDQPLNFSTIYSEKSPKNKKYTGNIINGKYHGRGILEKNIFLMV